MCNLLKTAVPERRPFRVTPQALADKKKDVMDEDILALVSDEVHQPEKLWDVLDLQVNPPSCCMLSCGRQAGRSPCLIHLRL